MAWYRAGTAAVTNGSVTVTGTGTDFVSNVAIGDSWLGPDGRAYEVASVTSATVLSLATAYLGASASGQGYAVQPTQSYVRDLALGAANLIGSFGAVRDGIGAGLVTTAGTVATPALRKSDDQDTGLFFPAANQVAIAAGGVLALFAGMTGVGIGTTTPAARLHVVSGAGADAFQASDATNYTLAIRSGGSAVALVTGTAGSALALGAGNVERARFDTAGNLIVGATTGGNHRFSKVGAAQGTVILSVDQGTYNSFIAYSVGSQGFSTAAAALLVGKDTTTGRSVNAGGTINASGADYAEYVRKADGCGTIAKGDVAGIDRDGRLTRSWAAALRFVVKSTDPNLVGGDSWSAHLDPRPERGEDEAEDAFAPRLAGWQAAFEAARQTVDRIAFCGQTPVNVDGETLAACEDALAAGEAVYLVAAASGAGIVARAVREAEMTLPRYMRRIGAVWAVRDGRPVVDVQHG